MSVYQIQLLLLYLGYNPGAADGVDGPGTQAAVRKFQADFGGLSVDGTAGTETQKALKCAIVYGSLRRDTGEPGKTGTFWEDIRHFQRGEFACKCGQHCDGFPAEPEESLIRAAEEVREHFGAPVTVSSGVRCPAHNARVGGVSNSRHLTGKAMDFSVAGIPAATVLAYVTQLPRIRYAYAVDGSFVHMDIP